MFTGTKDLKISENTTIFVDNGDTVDLNCTCDKSSWHGPDGSKAMRDYTALVMYSDGLQINPNLNITNVDIYGNFTKGLCHLKINNFSIVNDGIYRCSHFLDDIPYVSYYNIYSKSKLNTLVLFALSAGNKCFANEFRQVRSTPEIVKAKYEKLYY